jgi:hypothetical protein
MILILSSFLSFAWSCGVICTALLQPLNADASNTPQDTDCLQRE